MMIVTIVTIVIMVILTDVIKNINIIKVKVIVREGDLLLFNNSRTRGKLLACPHLPITKVFISFEGRLYSSYEDDTEKHDDDGNNRWTMWRRHLRVLDAERRRQLIIILLFTI